VAIGRAAERSRGQRHLRIGGGGWISLLPVGGPPPKKKKPKKKKPKKGRASPPRGRREGKGKKVRAVHGKPSAS
jgi:hypothetical protein